MTVSDKVTKRVTRSDGIPLVEWQTGRKEGDPIRRYTRLDVTALEATDNVQDITFLESTDNVQEMQDNDDEIYGEETCENNDQNQENAITQEDETIEENGTTDDYLPTNRDEILQQKIQNKFQKWYER